MLKEGFVVKVTDSTELTQRVAFVGLILWIALSFVPGQFLSRVRLVFTGEQLEIVEANGAIEQVVLPAYVLLQA